MGRQNRNKSTAGSPDEPISTRIVRLGLCEGSKITTEELGSVPGFPHDNNCAEGYFNELLYVADPVADAVFADLAKKSVSAMSGNGNSNAVATEEGAAVGVDDVKMCPFGAAQVAAGMSKEDTENAMASCPVAGIRSNQTTNTNAESPKTNAKKGTMALVDEMLAKEPETMAKLLGLETNPDWLDVEAVKRGFGVPRVDSVLSFTGYLNGDTKKIHLRLLETAEMVLDAMKPGELTKVGGDGWKSVVRVRFLHCGVRSRIWARNRRLLNEVGAVNDGDENVEDVLVKSVQPINQADMAATIMSFQTAVLLGMEHLGKSVKEQEQADYTALWRYIAHLIGTHDEKNPCNWGYQASVKLLHGYMRLFSIHSPVVDLSTGSLTNLRLNPAATSEEVRKGGGVGKDSKMSETEISSEPVSTPPHQSMSPTATPSRHLFLSPRPTRPSTPTGDSSAGTSEEMESHILRANKLSMGVLRATSEHGILRKPILVHVSMLRLIVGDDMADRLLLPSVNRFHRYNARFSFWLMAVLAWMTTWPVVGEWLMKRVRITAEILLKKMLVKAKMDIGGGN
ncbi:hypothetical protein HDU76_003451, partial [Blyttiomyces sp. JEL0837]